jgi:GT2 family glycosyltransferase
MDYTGYDIIVTDNGSHDGSGKQLKNNHPGIILIESTTNLGFTGGNNLGMQYAIDHNYTYALLLNNDTFVEKYFLEKLVLYLDEHPSVGVIQPMIYFNHNRSLIWNGGSYYNKLLGYAYTVNYNKPLAPENNMVKTVDWITGCAFMTRTSILKQAGLLADNLFIYYEDVDLSFRIKKLGYELIYYPASAIYHIAGMSNRNKEKGKEGFVNPIVHYLNTRNRIWLLKKYTSTLYFPTVCLFNFFYIIAVMAYFAARFRFTKFKTIMRAVKDGLTGRIIYK